MIKKISIFIAGLLFVVSGNLLAANDTSDEAKIKTVIKQAFVKEYSARAEALEYDGQVIPGKDRKAAFDELTEYVSNKKGYLDNLKDLVGLKEGNEKLFFARPLKKRFKEFDFKTVAIDGDTATVEVDIYTETTTRMGAQTNTVIKTDQYDNVIGVETLESKEHEIVTPGGRKHFITLELIDNKWQVVWDDSDFLPEYRP